jgi:hypothetical protein
MCGNGFSFHPPEFDHVRVNGEIRKSFTSSPCIFPGHPAAYTLPVPNIPFSTLSRNTLELCFNFRAGMANLSSARCQTHRKLLYYGPSTSWRVNELVLYISRHLSNSLARVWCWHQHKPRSFRSRDNSLSHAYAHFTVQYDLRDNKRYVLGIRISMDNRLYPVWTHKQKTYRKN